VEISIGCFLEVYRYPSDLKGAAMFQIVIEIEHIADEEKKDKEYNFEIKVHLVGGDSSCEHEVVIGNLCAGSLKQAQETIMKTAIKIFTEGQDKDKHNHKGNGHESGGILH